MVEYIIEQTFAGLEVADGLRVLDPAMGSGHFLVAAMRCLAKRLVAADESRSSGEPDARLREAMHYVATHCLWGIDLDPLAVQLARASLWLEIGLPQARFDAFNERLRCGDALLQERFADAIEFDCIVGNPPYGSVGVAELKQRYKQQLPQMKHNGDLAVGFLERCSQLLAPRGRCGLIVPKPLTYSYAWREMRNLLGRRIEHIVDVSRAWPEVKLEQVIVIFSRQMTGDSYWATALTGDGFARPARLNWRWAERFGTLPCNLDDQEQRRLAALDLSRETVGDLAKTWRGLPLQSRLCPEGEISVAGGRDLDRWRVRGCSGFVSSAELNGKREEFAIPKLVLQNIIAHVTRPRPHIKLIGAYDGEGRLTLDTVNNLTPRSGSLPLHGLLALLHSRLVNWFVYSVIYNKAIRTMHFDQYFLDKIPLPTGHEELLQRLAALSGEMEQIELRLSEIESELSAELIEGSGAKPSRKALARLIAGQLNASSRDVALVSRSETATMRAKPLVERRSAVFDEIDR
jgi:hypothetical protein